LIELARTGAGIDYGKMSEDERTEFLVKDSQRLGH